MKIKLISSLLLLPLLCGCILMRYEFINAINNLPPGSKLTYVGNYHLKYTLSNITYKAWYWPDGEIYKTVIISQ